MEGPPPRPPALDLAMTGERFEFQTSAKAGDGVFRFRWTLASEKKGPPEHVHSGETETFAVVSGKLRLWMDGEPRDLGPGESVAVAPGVRHRFWNPGPEPVVVDVSLDGTRMEDALVPLAFAFAGKPKLGIGDIATMIVHDVEADGSRPGSRVAHAVFRGVAWLARLFGARPLPRADAW